jgi:hypothetical protein
MAILDSILSMTGSLDNLSFYKVKGSNKVHVRRKGGVSKKRMKTDPNFAKLRLHQKEFAGRTIAGQMVAHATYPLRSIRNYNLVGALHKPFKAIQDRDPKNKLGERGISLSENPRLLEGLSLNTKRNLESIVAAPIQHSITETGEAIVQIPQLIPGINLHLSPTSQYYRIIAVLGAVPDIHFQNDKYVSSVPNLDRGPCIYDTTGWFHSSSNMDPHTFRLLPTEALATNNFVWMLSLGIEIGHQKTFDRIETADGEGAARILRIAPGGRTGESSS